MKRILLLLLFFSLFVNFCFAQNPLIDSLKTAKGKEDSDIKEFIIQIINPNRSKIDSNLLENYSEIYEPLPF